MQKFPDKQQNSQTFQSKQNALIFQKVGTLLMLFKQIVDGLSLPVFQYIVAVDFVQQFVQTSFAKQVMLNSP